MHLPSQFATCPSELALERYLSGDATNDDSVLIDEHLSSCARCEAWLRAARADEALVGPLREVLRSADSSSGGDLRPTTAAPATRVPRVEGYQIGAKLGEGGMGVVFAATQLNPGRDVALKLMRAARLLDDHAIRLFQRETRALARLRHPAIATIYDAGSTRAGEHYFAMERIHGDSLTDFAVRRNLSLRQRLELFRVACDAVHYAHQRGVIHRDLKPSNILVDADGQPKVLDFGLARISDVDDDSAATLTEIGRVQGTLTYMSPEQARGDSDAIGAASDVYSLGVILFQLLTGKLPYDPPRGALHEAVRVICESSPRRPSSIVPTLRGDLEVIILKALEKVPQRRYSSAAALADDIERWLEKQPISARPAGALYQIQKLVARKPLAAIATATVFFASVATAVWMRALYVQSEQHRSDADHARDMAQQSAATAHEVQRFLQDTFQCVDPERARGRDTQLLRELLDATALRVEIELADRPAVAAALHATLGKTYYRLSDYASAEKHLRAAYELEPGRSGRDAGPFMAILGDYADALTRRGRLDDAERIDREAMQTLERAGRANSADYSVCLARLAQLRADRGATHEGEQIARQALELQRSVLPEDDPRIAQSLNTLALALAGRGAFAEAQPLYEEALALLQRVRGPDHPDTARTANNLGMMLQQKGDLDAAEQMLGDALALRRRILGDSHADTVLSINNLATVYMARRNAAAAEPLIREALAGFRRIHGEPHARVAIALNNLGLALEMLEQFEEAEEALRQALAMRKQLFGDENPEVAMAHHNLANFILKRGRNDDAEPLFRIAVETAERVLPARHPYLGIYRGNYGKCLLALQRFDDAQRELEPALSILEEKFGPTHERTLFVVDVLMRLAEALGDSEAAQRFRARLSSASGE